MEAGSSHIGYQHLCVNHRLLEEVNVKLSYSEPTLDAYQTQKDGYPYPSEEKDGYPLLKGREGVPPSLKM